MAETLSKEQQKEYAEELEYQEANEPNPADQDAQQRRQASVQKKKELKELEESQYGSEREEQESEVEHYRTQHPERSTRDVVHEVKGKAKEIGGGIFSKISQKVTGPSRWDKIREENIRKQTGGGKGVTKEDVQKMISGKKGMSKGQFHAPGKAHSTSFIDPFPHGGGGRGGGFPNVDPLGGMGGGGKHMMDFSMGPRPAAKNQVRATVVQQRAPPRPITKAPKMFQDPFAGLPKGGPKRSFDVQKDIGKGLGLGTGKKSAKKLRNVSDWMNF
jgi:hypothetical protein